VPEDVFAGPGTGGVKIGFEAFTGPYKRDMYVVAEEEDKLTGPTTGTKAIPLPITTEAPEEAFTETMPCGPGLGGGGAIRELFVVLEKTTPFAPSLALPPRAELVKVAAVKEIIVKQFLIILN
jgi:hypothetical protein